MHRFKTLMSILLTLGMWPSGAAAQDKADSVKLLNIQQFLPTLRLDKNPALCAAHQAAWTRLYKGEYQLSPIRLDIEKDIPGAQKLDFNSWKKTSVTLDYDSDGNDEIFYIEYIVPMSARPESVNLFLYESQSDLEADIASGALDAEGRVLSHSLSGILKHKENTRAKNLGNFESRSTFFSLNGELYVQSLQTTGRNNPYEAKLDVLTPGQQRVPVCVLNLRAPYSEDNSKIDILYPLSLVAGGAGRDQYGRQCPGRRGRFPDLGASRTNILHRPQAINNLGGRKSKSAEVRDVRREYKFTVWGMSDPTSFAVIKDIKAQYPKFIQEFVLYYQIYFDMDAKKSRETAELAYRYLLDSAYPTSWQGHGFGIGFENSKIGPGTSLEEFANFVIDNAIKTESGKPTILKLGLLAGVEAQKLEILSNYTMDFKTRYGQNYSEAVDKQYRQPLVNDLFLASLTHPEMMKHFIELGAEVDISTTYFGKTALMYAAQNNDLDAVNLLLSAGANPNAQTKQDEDTCARVLDRDSRTPLMYAAENANASLILSLLEAGADPAATDTKGNSALWYLDRNSNLPETQKENIKRRL